MDQQEVQLFMLTLAALADDGTAETGMIDNAEPMEATCTVER